jgi:major membrane immunogen (membrane-anchored lipoprotein)
MEKRTDPMKKMTITIAICSTLLLAACGKTGETEQGSTSLSEQSTSDTSTQSEQAAFEVNDKGESTQATKASH